MKINISNLNIDLNLQYAEIGKKDLLAYEEMFKNAFLEIQKIENGEKVNNSEDRMVGHYWLRNPAISPSAEINDAISFEVEKIKKFAKTNSNFENLIIVGIGGSCLGPQFLERALSATKSNVSTFYLDNTDPEGVEVTLRAVKDLSKTLVLVVSKSGGTKETRNSCILAKKAYEEKGLSLGNHFAAVTVPGSKLDLQAKSEGWLDSFALWDWVGGRTSMWSAVGILPLAIQGYDIDKFLTGASMMDAHTRKEGFFDNPAALLAASWHFLGGGKGEKSMVVLPYKDSLSLFSKYLQQLIMESLGKECDRAGNVVNQGIPVYGNKGSTDQHSYVQQLREGPNNFFAVFVQVLKESVCNDSYNLKSIEVEGGISATDYLFSFMLGTRKALFEKGKKSLTISMFEVNEESLGALVALFERAVGIYASFVNINAYDQPGVEAGKVAAGDIIRLIKEIKKSGKLTVEEFCESYAGDCPKEMLEEVFQHLSVNTLIN